MAVRELCVWLALAAVLGCANAGKQTKNSSGDPSPPAIGGTGPVEDSGGGEPSAAGALQLLYDRGAVRPRAVAVAAGLLFWTEEGQGTKVFQAAADGSGIPLQIGEWRTRERSHHVLGADSEYAFWVVGEEVRVVRHDGTPVVTVPLAGGIGLAGLVADAAALWVADDSCRGFQVISRTDWSAERIPIPEPHYLGGVLGLAQDDANVYCGRGADIHVLNKRTRELGRRTFEHDHIGPVASNGTDLYWVNNENPVGTGLERLFTAPITGGSAIDLGHPGGVGQTAKLDVDTGRSKAYLVTGPNPFGPVPISALDTKTRQLSDIGTVTEPATGGTAQDAEYLYVVTQNKIWRIPKG